MMEEVLNHFTDDLRSQNDHECECDDEKTNTMRPNCRAHCIVNRYFTVLLLCWFFVAAAAAVYEQMYKYYILYAQVYPAYAFVSTYYKILLFFNVRVMLHCDIRAHNVLTINKA